jgi:hypothetical protein
VHSHPSTGLNQNPNLSSLKGVHIDVHCSTCGEPWDIHHLGHDAIHETDLAHEEAAAWTELSPKLRLSQRDREKFKAAGYQFGNSVYDLRRCPCCPKDAKLDVDTASAKAAIVDMLGDDEDGIAALVEHFDL